jgi:hypothetical protein
MKRFAALLVILVAGCEQPAEYKVGDRLEAPPARESAAAPASAAVREITWDDLLPEGWDPMAVIDTLNLDSLDDADPRATKAMEKLKSMWSEAPSNPAIAGKAVRIPGFTVPLELRRREVKEFLLVPYFGACIHVPPPPANQVIHVVADRPVALAEGMQAVWVEGVIELDTLSTEMGDAGYRLRASKVEPYGETP